jgi:hypothetical protein
MSAQQNQQPSVHRLQQPTRVGNRTLPEAPDVYFRRQIFWTHAQHKQTTIHKILIINQTTPTTKTTWPTANDQPSTKTLQLVQQRLIKRHIWSTIHKIR